MSTDEETRGVDIDIRMRANALDGWARNRCLAHIAPAFGGLTCDN